MTALHDIADLDTRFLAVAEMESHRGDAFAVWIHQFARRGAAWFQPEDQEAAKRHFYDVAESQFLSAPFCNSAEEIADEYVESIRQGEAA